MGPDDLNVFKYNEDKTLSWLKKKCLAVVEALKKSNVSTGQNVTSQTFVNVNAVNDESKSDVFDISLNQMLLFQN